MLTNSVKFSTLNLLHLRLEVGDEHTYFTMTIRFTEINSPARSR